MKSTRSRRFALATALCAALAATPASALNYVVVNANNAGAGSLRQAIANANANPGPDTISFAIPGPGPYVIPLAAALPVVTSPVTIDGLTQPGAACPAGAWAPVLQIDLNGGGIAADGLSFAAGANGSVLRGLVIRGFNGNGVVLTGNNNALECNFIGTNNLGTVALPNTANGVRILGTGQVIGGGLASMRNLISGNGGHGISVEPAAGGNQNNAIVNNFIGLSVGGAVGLGNGGDGVAVINGAASGTHLHANWIGSNVGLGIDLNNDGVTANDAAPDADVGPNSFQNFPVLAGAVAGTGTITGTLTSSAELFRVDFFQSAACDATGNGEGETFLGSVWVNSGVAFTSPVFPLVAGRFVTATATRHIGGGVRDTSEFSPCFAVVP